MPKVTILIVSYAHDLPYLRYNLDSIEKFATGFAGVTLVVPEQEASEFASLAASYKCELKTYKRTPDRLKWHLAAQAEKCFADKYCPDADFILHTDSDCIFTESVTPDDYFVNGKPVMLIKEWSLCPGNPWKPVVDAVLKTDSKYSTMERHPQVNPRRAYPALRLTLSALHRMPFDEFVLSLKPDFPWGFTEHNILGNIALELMPQAYHWIDAGKQDPPHEKLRQFWSLSPPDKPQHSPHAGPMCVPIEIIRQTLGQ